MAQMNVGGGTSTKTYKAPTIKKPAAPKPVVKKNYEVLASQKGLPMTGVKTSSTYKAPVSAPKAPAPKAPASKPASYSGGSSGGGGGGGGSNSGGATINLAPPAPKYDPMKDPVYLASLAKLNDLWNQASGYKGQIDGMMKDGFTYDPEKDASYKSLQTLATKQAGIATKESMEAMNDRGILNSTVMTDRAGQIAQTAQDAVTAQVPGLKNAAYGMYMDKLSTLNNLWNSTVAQAQQERGFNEDKRRWELGYEMDVNQFNTSKDQWNKTFDYNAAQTDIQNAFKNQEYDLAYLASVQDSIGVNNKANTNAALGELIGYKTKADVIAQLQKNRQAYVQNGVNISELLKALNSYFPGIETEAKKSNNKLL